MRTGKNQSTIESPQPAAKMPGSRSAGAGRAAVALIRGNGQGLREGREQAWAGAFTLLELMMVLTLILILAALAVPTYRLAIVRAREAVLRDDLYTLRKLIDEYTLDKQQPPSALDDLVQAGYLRGGIPVDPFTGSNQTWRVDSEDVPIGPSQLVPGIVDVHSGSEDVSLDGMTPYNTW
jgi:general secretion pathway protein G